MVWREWREIEQAIMEGVFEEEKGKKSKNRNMLGMNESEESVLEMSEIGDGSSAMTAVVVDDDDENEDCSSERHRKQCSPKAESARGRLGRILARASQSKLDEYDSHDDDDEDEDDEDGRAKQSSSKRSHTTISRRVSNASSSSSSSSSSSISSSFSCSSPEYYQPSYSYGRKRPRRSRRGNCSLDVLASLITSGKNVVMVTGAGLSVNSGIRPFRGKEGLWSEVIWTNATREAFREDPCTWYNNFWLKHFPPSSYDAHKPNAAHEAIAKIATLPNTNLNVITQNIDGLHSSTNHPWDYEQRLIEAHGRLGLYKCIPEEDSDTDEDSDDDEERPVKLGSRRKSRALRSTTNTSSSDNNNNDDDDDAAPKMCKYESQSSIPSQNLLGSRKTKSILSPSSDDSHSHQKKKKKKKLTDPPLCPHCLRPAPPQALLFDEGYHSHSHYQFQKMESWLSNADVLIFVGTSFAVTITDVALQHARECNIPVYNFNIDGKVGSNGGSLESTTRLDATNITGDVGETLPKLWSACDEMISRRYRCAL